MSSPILEAIIRAVEKVAIAGYEKDGEAIYYSHIAPRDLLTSLREEMEKEPAHCTDCGSEIHNAACRCRVRSGNDPIGLEEQPASVFVHDGGFSNVKEKLVYSPENYLGYADRIRQDEREKVLETLLSFIDEVAKNRELEGLRMQVEAIHQKIEEMKK